MKAESRPSLLCTHIDTSFYVKLWYMAVYLRINYVG